jgi:hypothetical protein
MFKFSIRDVLWLTLVAGLAVGWWVDRWQQAVARQAGERILLEMVVKAQMERDEALYGKPPPINGNLPVTP